MWLTWANALSLTRLIAAPLTAWAVIGDAWTAAFGLFVVAVVTDLVDGPVARRRNTASDLGGKVDHTCDAVYVVVTLTALGIQGYVNLALPVLIALAFAQYVIDSGAHRQRPLRASMLGRWNGVAYFVLVGIPVVQNGINLQLFASTWVLALSWILIASTLISMLDRFLARFR